MARVSSIFTLVVVYILLIFDTDGASATPTPEVAAAGQPKCHKIKKRQEWWGFIAHSTPGTHADLYSEGTN